MEKDYERLKYDSTQFEKETNHQILQLSNDIKEMQKKLEEKIAERNQMQGVYEEQQNDSSSKTLSLGRILMAVENIHARCSEGLQKIKEDHELQQQEEQKQKMEISTKQQAKTANAQAQLPQVNQATQVI